MVRTITLDFNSSCTFCKKCNDWKSELHGKCVTCSDPTIICYYTWSYQGKWGTGDNAIPLEMVFEKNE